MTCRCCGGGAVCAQSKPQQRPRLAAYRDFDCLYGRAEHCGHKCVAGGLYKRKTNDVRVSRAQGRQADDGRCAASMAVATKESADKSKRC